METGATAVSTADSEITPRARHLLKLLQLWTIRFTTEYVMQADVQQILASENLRFNREFVLNSKDRIDFLVDAVGIECKTSGSRNEVMRQLSRYACDKRVDELLLLTSHASHRTLAGITLQGKPVFVHWINNFV